MDSQAAIKALDKFDTKNKLVANCKRKINQLARRNTVSLNWIPAHVGHRGNEVADRLAKRGAALPEPDRIPPIPVSAVKQEIFRWEQSAHRKTWRRRAVDKDGKTFCRQTRMFLPDPNPRLWKKIRKYNIRKIKILTQMITGHSTLQRHLEVMKIIPDGTCEQCLDEDETVQHFICDCEAFHSPRREILGEFFLKQEELQHLDLDVLLKYVKRTKRFALDE